MKVPEKIIKTIEGGSHSVVQKAESLVIDSNESAEGSAELLKEIKIQLNNAEDTRKSFTQPLNESLRNINEAFKKATEPLTKAESIIKNKILTWRREENERIQREEARRQKLQMAHYSKGHNVNPLVQMDRVQKVGATSTKKVWRWELKSFKDLPDEFKMTNDVAINQAIREGKREIKGLRVYEDEVLAVSTK